MVLLLAKIIGVGIETTDMLVNEVLSLGLRDQRAVARYAGIPVRPTRAAPSGAKRGSPRLATPEYGGEMLQLAWRWLMFQKASSLAQWYRARMENAPPRMRKIMIVALATKLLIALWRFTKTSEIPSSAVLHSA